MPAGLLAASLVAAAPAGAQDQAHAGGNPCLDPERRAQLELRCPNLTVAPPDDLYEEKRDGRQLLRAATSIESLGRGPVELNARRASKRRMRARQLIERPGRDATFRTGAELRFVRVSDYGRFWKLSHAARAELWRLDGRGHRTELIARSPKQAYCLSDIVHTHPEFKGSPRSRVYLGCSQDPDSRRTTLGISVGWTDIYESSFDQQWVDVTDVERRGCYAYVNIADPRDVLHERREHDNESSTVVRLDGDGGLVGLCEGRRDRGVPAFSASSRPDSSTEVRRRPRARRCGHLPVSPATFGVGQVS